ncbi:MAG: hypothetical protein V8T87_08105 [Victivallales bacterium]
MKQEFFGRLLQQSRDYHDKVRQSEEWGLPCRNREACPHTCTEYRTEGLHRDMSSSLFPENAALFTRRDTGRRTGNTGRKPEIQLYRGNS